MRISIEDLRKSPKEIDLRASPGELGVAAEGYGFPEPITGHVRLQMVNKNILATGHLETRVETVCVRCLKDIARPIRAEVGLVFEKRPEATDGDGARLSSDWDAEAREIDYYEEEYVDPTDAFRQLLLLELPQYAVCGEQCRGLCPTCGGDLNEGACRCDQTAATGAEEPDWKARLRNFRLDG
jgi:uncharacterized protein